MSPPAAAISTGRQLAAGAAGYTRAAEVRARIKWRRCMKSRLISAALVLATVTALDAARLVHAQDYPSRPIRVVVGPGPDIVARLLGPKMTEVLGQPIVVEQRPGAGGVIASQTVSSAPADGYMLLQAT